MATTPANDLNISNSGYVSFNSSTGAFSERTFQAGTGITITNPDGVSGNSTIASTASLTDLHTARFIVASSTAGTGANFTSITSAIAAAQGTGVNSTIFLQPGTYTENFTLTPGINLAAYVCDAFTPNVTINGKITMTSAGTCSISGIRLQTNGDFALAVTGSAASVMNLTDCYINCTNHTGISYTSSSGSSSVNVYNCIFDHTTTGISAITATGTGTVYFRYVIFNNSGGTTTASTTSACMIFLDYCQSLICFSYSSTGSMGGTATFINTSAINTTCITTAGTGSCAFISTAFSSGTASAISIGSGTTVNLFSCSVSSSNTNAITGSGTLIYSPINFSGSSSTVNTSTQTPEQIGPKIYTNGGISFNGGTDVLSTYHTATWTPNLQINGSNTGITYSNQTGGYTQIGNVVIFWINVILSSKGAGTGAVTISNFPVSTSTNGGAQNIPLNNFNNFTAAGYTSINLQLGTSSTVASMVTCGSGVATAAVSNSNITNTFSFSTTGIYIVD